MSKRHPFGWHELTPAAAQLIRDQPAKFERMELTDGPVAQGRLIAGPVSLRASQQLDLFADAPAPADDDQQELFG